MVDLFKGVGVIVDDHLNNDSKETLDKIFQIKSNFEEQNIPILTYNSLPFDEMENFGSISFILLDWNLSELPEGIPMPDVVIEDNIDFIKRLEKICFIPIFIFTNESVDTVIDILNRKELYDLNSENNHIFVKNKDELCNVSDFNREINDWINRTPSIYVLKEWENEIKRATISLFYDLYKISPAWPYIMNKTYLDDIKNDNCEMFELINRNLFARCSPIIFNDKFLEKGGKYKVAKEDLRKILECERYIKKDSLQDFPALGDIFKKSGYYYINMSPDCDIVRVDNPDLICVKAEKVNETKINKDSRYKIEHGSFIEQTGYSIVPFVDNGKFLDVKFKHIKLFKWEDIKENRIGRLIPPYITRLKLQYISYFQRQGIPAIPLEAISSSSENSDPETF